MEFNILKHSGGLVKFSPFIFIIEEDEFYYKKRKMMRILKDII